MADYGVSRKGRIIAEFTGLYPDSNSIINILFLNYTFGQYTIDGNIIIVNRGRNEQGQPYLTFFVQNGSIATERATISWQANKSWTLTAGSATPSLADDVYMVNGTSFGMNADGNEFDTEVLEENRILTDCLHITAGTSTINIRNLSPRRVDYGNGACDRNAVVSINGKEHQVTIPQ